MSIDINPLNSALVQQSNKQKSEGTGTPAGKEQNNQTQQDSVNLGNFENAMNKLQDAIAKVPDVDMDKVASIKAAIQSGQFEVNASKIADQIIEYQGDIK